MESDFPMRINKYLAKAGYASRRAADKLIEEGQVFVNGKQAVMGQKVEESDVVEIQNFDTSNLRYVLYYKPAGLETLATSKGESDVISELSKRCATEGLFPIGRLDKDTEGLLVLTNDGRLTTKIQENPVTQTYEVIVDREVTEPLINHINRGVKIESHIARSAKASFIKGNPNALLITLSENKRYNVRSICAAIGLRPLSLKRVAYASFELKRLKPGEFYELKQKEARELQTSLGLK